MKARSSCRHGFTMVAVVLLITLVGGVITLMTFNASYFYRSHKLERSRCVLLAITESAVAYTQAHRDAWRKSPPGEPIVLNMKALMPADAECSSKIEVRTAGSSPICHLTSQLNWGTTHVENERDIDLNTGSTTLPASDTQ